MINIFFIKNMKIITVVELKRIMTSASIFGIVKSKFSHQKESSLVVLFRVNKDIPP